MNKPDNGTKQNLVEGPDDCGAKGRQICHAVSTASRNGVYRAKCLPQALVGWRLLARSHIPAELKLGVRKDRAGFAAHAWVESGGRILLGGEESAAGHHEFNITS